MGNQPPDRAFGERIKEIISSSVYAGHALHVIAKRWGVSPAMISYYKSGEKLPSMKSAMRIAMDSGFCVEYILTGRGPKHPPGTNGGNGDGIEEPPWQSLPPEERTRFAEALHAVADQVARYKKGKMSAE